MKGFSDKNLWRMKQFYFRLTIKEKYTEVVEYAMSRNLSPALVAEYRTKLIAKRILQQKLHELFKLPENNPDDQDINT